MPVTDLPLFKKVSLSKKNIFFQFYAFQYYRSLKIFCEFQNWFVNSPIGSRTMSGIHNSFSTTIQWYWKNSHHNRNNRIQQKFTLLQICLHCGFCYHFQNIKYQNMFWFGIEAMKFILFCCYILFLNVICRFQKLLGKFWLCRSIQETQHHLMWSRSLAAQYQRRDWKRNDAIVKNNGIKRTNQITSETIHELFIKLLDYTWSRI